MGKVSLCWKIIEDFTKEMTPTQTEYFFFQSGLWVHSTISMGSYFRGNPKGCWSSFRVVEFPSIMVWHAAVPHSPCWEFLQRSMCSFHHCFSHPQHCSECQGASSASSLFSSCTGCFNLGFIWNKHFNFVGNSVNFKSYFPWDLNFFSQLCKAPF